MNSLNAEQMSPRAPAFPCVFKFSDIRIYIFIAAFVLLDVAVPWALHRLHPLAGPTFLPLFFFSLLAGLLFGWRVGLLVGLISPIVGYLVSGSPALWRLVEIIIENSVFGFSAGLLAPRLKSSAVWSLLGALIAGYLALILSVLIFHPEKVNPLVWAVQTIQQGWPGIAIQLVCLPLIIRKLNDWLSKRNQRANNG